MPTVLFKCRGYIGAQGPGVPLLLNSWRFVVCGLGRIQIGDDCWKYTNSYHVFKKNSHCRMVNIIPATSLLIV